jgi:hypothetical protein
MEASDTTRESCGSLPAARTEPGEVEETQEGVLTPPRKDKSSNKQKKKISTLPNREAPLAPLGGYSAHSPLSKKNEADPDSQKMRTGAGNQYQYHEEVLSARNSYQI